MIGVVFFTGNGSWSFGSQPLVNSVQVAYWLLVYVLPHGAVVAMETPRLVLNPYQAF